MAAYAVLGRAPFGRGMPNAVFYRVIHEAPDLNGCPSRLRTLIEQCLAKQPADRPQLGQILRFCLENADAGADSTLTQPVYRRPAQATRHSDKTDTAIQVEPPPPPPSPVAPSGAGRRHRRPAKRRPRRAVLLAIGALAVAAAATAYALPGNPSSANSTGPAPAGRWSLASADGTTVSDATGKHPATATNVHWSAGNSGAAFDGSDSQVSTAPALRQRRTAGHRHRHHPLRRQRRPGDRPRRVRR